MVLDSSRPRRNAAGFYGEVDRFRYRTNWGCLVWLLLLLVAVVIAGWWVYRRA